MILFFSSETLKLSTCYGHRWYRVTLINNTHFFVYFKYFAAERNGIRQKYKNVVSVYGGNIVNAFDYFCVFQWWLSCSHKCKLLNSSNETPCRRNLPWHNGICKVTYTPKIFYDWALSCVWLSNSSCSSTISAVPIAWVLYR